MLALAVLVAMLAPRGWFGEAPDGADLSGGQGRLRVGFAVEEPWALLEADGAVGGLSPSTARLIAGGMGITDIAWVQLSFGELIPALLQSRIDVIASGLFITPERQSRVRFSAPTLQVVPAVLVRAGEGARVAPGGRLDLGRGVRIAAVEGSVEQLRLGRCALPDGQLVMVPDARSGIAATQQGVVDGLVLSLPTLRRASAGRSAAMEVLPLLAADGLPATVDHVGFAFRPGDRALAEAWDRAQAQVIGSPAHRTLIAGAGFEPADFVAMGGALPLRSELACPAPLT